MIKVRRVKKGDLSRMREVVESAFGDFFERQLGTRPRQVFGGAQYVHHRWLMEPWGCFVAEENEGKIVGASIAVCWGTVGLFGPVAVLTLYQKFGFKPRALVGLTAKSIERREPAAPPPPKPARGAPEVLRFSTYEESK